MFSMKNWLSILSLSAFLVVCSRAQVVPGEQGCDYSRIPFGYKALNLDYCIMNYVQSNTTFTLPPLLPSPLTFVYAADELTSQDNPGNNYGDNKHSLTSWWLEFDPNQVKLVDDSLKTPMVITLTNFFPRLPDSSAGGGNGGCDELLGKECLDSITKTLKAIAFDAFIPGANETSPNYGIDYGGIDFPVEAMWKNKALRGNVTECPTDFFKEVQSVTSKGNSSVIAIQMPNVIGEENDGSMLYSTNDRNIIYPGNSTWGFQRNFTGFRSLQEQEDYAAVAIMLRVQKLDSYYKLAKKRDDKTFNLAFSCAKLPKTVAQGSDTGRGSTLIIQQWMITMSLGLVFFMMLI